MDIELRTNDHACALALRDAFPEDDYPTYRTRLFVKSAGFAADRRFWVEREALSDFLEQVRAMDRTLTGRALLQPLHELDRVEFEVTHTGGILVSGELGYPSDNYLKFEFQTDQTCLTPLIRDLERLLQASSQTSQRI